MHDSGLTPAFRRNLKRTRHRDEREKWSMEMIMSKSKPMTLGAAIFYGGLIAGILDAADGVVAYEARGGDVVV